MNRDLVLDTPKLVLKPATPEAIDALIARDASRLWRLLGVRFREPVEAPPLMADALPYLRDQLREEDLSWSWIAARCDTDEAVGFIGFNKIAAVPRTFFIGWSIYPAHQGQGFATEACRAVLGCAFARLGGERVEATIPPDNVTSLKVAARNGMTEIGREQDPEVGEVIRVARVR